MTATALQVVGLSVAYDGAPVVLDVDLYVPPGVILGIVGPNGAGKSSLLKAVLGVLQPLAGQVRIFGQPLGDQWSRVAYVPQRSGVDWDFPTTVFDLVLMGTYGQLGWFQRPKAKEREQTLNALRMVEMDEFADRQIGELSGGQQQRVFLARALVQNVDLYLMDEPFAGVDATTERTIIALLHELRRQGKTIVVVHHDLSTVTEYFDHVALLNRELIATGPVATTFVSEHLEATYGGPVRGTTAESNSQSPSSSHGSSDD
ncbi:MAG: metal ABC transporter ATP-binding protein [Planctomycetota bacterium]